MKIIEKIEPEHKPLLITVLFLEINRLEAVGKKIERIEVSVAEMHELRVMLLKSGAPSRHQPITIFGYPIKVVPAIGEIVPAGWPT